ncbi:MAG: hypothetical protein ABSB76_36480, partial [Streptosporangiaceae bacterium]
MVSLGPLHAKRYCTYSCPFCYVNAQYGSFGSLGIPDIIGWVAAQDQSSFETIYVSGDTDSFAPPRLRLGVRLLQQLSFFGKDLLFTTRAPFDAEAMDAVGRLSEQLRSRGHWLFGCVSIAQLTVPHLEPRPVPAPAVRAAQLAEFRRRGLVAVLALRPFLPVVPLSDYAAILDLCDNSVDIVLGEDWYADVGGRLEEGVFQGQPPSGETVRGTMSFDSNTAEWKIYKLEAHEDFVRGECGRRG